MPKEEPTPAAIEAERDRLIEAVKASHSADAKLILANLANSQMTLPLLSSTKVGRAVKSVLKNKQLVSAHTDAQVLLAKWKSLVPQPPRPEQPSPEHPPEARPNKKARVDSKEPKEPFVPNWPQNATALHSTVAGYKKLLLQQRKDLHKDPPVCCQSHTQCRQSIAERVRVPSVASASCH